MYGRAPPGEAQPAGQAGQLLAGARRHDVVQPDERSETGVVVSALDDVGDPGDRANRSTGSSTSVASVVIRADSWLPPVADGAHGSRRHHREQRRRGQRRTQEVAPQRATDDGQHDIVHRRAGVPAEPCRVHRALMPVKRTVRRAVIGWLNGVRGAPNVPGTATSGCSRSQRRAAAHTSTALRSSAAARGAAPTGPAPGDPLQLGPSWLRVDGQRGRRRRGTAGQRLEVEQLHHQLGTRRAVEHGVVQLHDHPGAAVGQPLHDVQLPQRPTAVEGTGQHVRGDRFKVVDCDAPCSGQQDRRRRRSNRAACNPGGDRRAACAGPAADAGGHRSVRTGAAATPHRARTGIQDRRPRHMEVVGRRLQVQERRVQSAESLHPDEPTGRRRPAAQEPKPDGGPNSVPRNPATSTLSPGLEHMYGVSASVQRRPSGTTSGTHGRGILPAGEARDLAVLHSSRYAIHMFTPSPPFPIVPLAEPAQTTPSTLAERQPSAAAQRRPAVPGTPSQRRSDRRLRPAAPQPARRRSHP